MKKFLIVTGAMLTAGVLLIGGCVAVVGAGATAVDTEMKKQEKQERVTTAALAKRMKRVKLGMSQSKVRSILGDPSDTDASTSSVPDMDEETYEVEDREMKLETWTYGDLTADDGYWTLSFVDGKLDHKSRI